MTRSKTLFEAFEKRTKVRSDYCWEWAGRFGNSGYGSFTHKMKNYTSHRLSYTLFKGIIPKNMCVLHSCDNKWCVNPWHLRIGTHKENNRDHIIFGRNYAKNKTHCKSGHEFTEKNTYIEQRASGEKRGCKQCRRLAAAKFRKLNKKKVKMWMRKYYLKKVEERKNKATT